MNRPRIGDEAWFVSWCVELAFDECGDVNLDGCKDVSRRVATKEEAERMAKEVYPQTTKTFGFVEYWPATFVPYDEDDAEPYPHVGFWEPTADASYYDGD